MNLKTALLTAAAGAALAAPAADAQVNELRYVGTVTGTQTTTWSEPRHGAPGSDDCYHVNFTEGKGKDTIRFRSAGSTKVLVTRVGTGDHAFTHYGNWNPQSMGRKGIAVKVDHSRDYARTYETQPGECGGEGDTQVDEGIDCGSRSSGGFADLQFEDGRAEIYLHHDSPFDLCPVHVPEDVDEGAFTEVGPKMVGADLLDPKQGLHVLLGEDTFKESRHVPDGGTLTATTTVKWQLRLKRVT